MMMAVKGGTLNALQSNFTLIFAHNLDDPNLYNILSNLVLFSAFIKAPEFSPSCTEARISDAKISRVVEGPTLHLLCSSTNSSHQ